MEFYNSDLRVRKLESNFIFDGDISSNFKFNFDFI